MPLACPSAAVVGGQGALEQGTSPVREGDTPKCRAASSAGQPGPSPGHGNRSGCPASPLLWAEGQVAIQSPLPSPPFVTQSGAQGPSAQVPRGPRPVPEGYCPQSTGTPVCSERLLGGACSFQSGATCSWLGPRPLVLFSHGSRRCARARARPHGRSSEGWHGAGRGRGASPGVCAVVLTTVCSPECVTDGTAAVGGACGSRSPGAAVGSSSAARSHGGRGARRDTHSARPDGHRAPSRSRPGGAVPGPDSSGPGPPAPRRGYPLTGTVRGCRRRARGRGAVTLRAAWVAGVPDAPAPRSSAVKGTQPGAGEGL